MHITILGSGGYLRIPRACCSCKICSEARKKGVPYERLGQSLFIDDESILFDTPEDINVELNRCKIPKVEHLFYSHWHPDHTSGVRILETLRADRDLPPVSVHLTEDLKKDLEDKVRSIFFFEKSGFCSIGLSESAKIGSIDVKYVKLNNNFAYAFVIQSHGKKVVYCPCHCMELPVLDELKNADLLIANLGYFGSEIRNVTGFEKDNLRLIKLLSPKKTVLTHIEETWKKGYDDYCALEKKYKDYNLFFAFDGMKIRV